MKAIEYRTMEKAAWGPGPWQDEPDKVQYPDEVTGLPCLIVRNYSGALCGYVGVAEGHPDFGKPYEDVYIDVHGGLTFSNRCQPGADEAMGICHVPGEGEPDHVWWFGFDCAHYRDIVPRHNAYMNGGLDMEYRDMSYVKAQIRSLAAQLALKNEAAQDSHA